MKGLTSSNAKSGGERSGYCLEVGRIRPHSIGPAYSLTITWRLADKSESILLGRPICLRDEDCTGVSSSC